MGLSSRAAKVVVFATSGAVLVLEILAGRLMAPYVGVSLETFTGIIGTMLAGIAIGSAVGGRLADQRDPAAMVGPAMIIGGALSWVSLPILSALGPAVGSDPGSIVVLTAFAFLAPAVVLSAISPMVAKMKLESLADTGAVVGSLSAAGTWGALFGTFVTGFVLAASFPSRPIVIGIGVLLVLSGAVWMFRFTGSKPQPVAAGLLLIPLAGSALINSPCDVETAYACVSVEVDEDRPSGRSLVLDELRHSYIDLEDPTYLEFRYFHLFQDLIDPFTPGSSEVGAPINVLNMGGAGFAIPRYIEATRPGSTSLVLEIDDALVEVAKDDLGLELTDDLQVIVGDARLALDDLEPGSYDLIIGDAFGGRSVPWHLTTTEVMGQVEELLTDDGVYMMNLIDGKDSRYAKAQLATLAEHFDHIQIALPSDGIPSSFAVNQVIYATNGQLPEIVIDPEDGVLLSEAETLEYYDGAQVLRDDFAPVDQLAFSF